MINLLRSRRPTSRILYQLLGALSLGAVSSFSLAANPPTINLIIDDIGYSKRQAQALYDLPAKVTFAILPDTPYGKKISREARQRGHEVMLHLPMEPFNNANPSPRQLQKKMTREQFIRMLRKNLADIGQLDGVNNHMGSRLTTDPISMKMVMGELANRKDLFFVDSKTSSRSIAADVALKHGIPTTSRDIFLDTFKSEAFVEKQLNALIRKARKNGHAVGIGHPYPETLAVLKRRVGGIIRSGIKIVPVASRVKRSRPQIAPPPRPVRPMPSPAPEKQRDGEPALILVSKPSCERSHPYSNGSRNIHARLVADITCP